MEWKPGKGWLQFSLSHKGEEFRIRVKKIKVKFSAEVENTQSAKKQKLHPPDGMHTDFFASNGRQEIYDCRSDEIFKWPEKYCSNYIS